MVNKPIYTKWYCRFEDKFYNMTQICKECDRSNQFRIKPCAEHKLYWDYGGHRIHDTECTQYLIDDCCSKERSTRLNEWHYCSAISGKYKDWMVLRPIEDSLYPGTNEKYTCVDMHGMSRSERTNFLKRFKEESKQRKRKQTNK